MAVGLRMLRSIEICGNLAFGLQAVGMTINVKHFHLDELVPKVTVHQDSSGRIVLNAADANLHGKRIRYNMAESRKCIDNWFKLDDWCDWDTVVDKPGKFRVTDLHRQHKRSRRQSLHRRCKCRRRLGRRGHCQIDRQDERVSARYARHDRNPQARACLNRGACNVDAKIAHHDVKNDRANAGPMKPVRRGLSRRGPGKHDGLVDKDRRQAVVAEAEKPAFQVWFRVEHGELDEQPCGPEKRNQIRKPLAQAVYATPIRPGRKALACRIR